MPRAKKITENSQELNNNQVILVPLIDTTETVKLNIEVPEKTFERPLKKFGVYENKEFLMECDENSELLSSFLDLNKFELERRINLINELINDPNVLIFFHEGKQNRTYMSFEAYYAQNGLAPKKLSITTWAEYYRSVNPLLSDEEIAIHKFGDLPFSFVIMENE